MAVVGYERVSSRDQNLDRQTEKLKEFGAEKIYSDKLSGKNTDRPGLKKMLEFVREGDTVVILSFDRLARSLPDLLKLVEQLQGQGVELVSLKEAVDTSTPSGKLQLAIFGGMAEFSRSIIAEARDQGISSARARGQKFGRPVVAVPAEFDREVRLWRAGKQSAVDTFKKLKMTKTSFYKVVKVRGL